MLVLGTALPTVAMADAIDDLVAKAPEHAVMPVDTLVDNGDGTYDVTLSVTGATEETESPRPIDVIYLVDSSLSMAGDLSTARKAITAAANKYLTAENAALPADQQVQMAVITYGRKAQVKQGFTNKASDITSALPSVAAEAGTNWEAALTAANGLNGRAGAEKRIVLLSDSGPTLRTSAEGYNGLPHIDGTYGTTTGDPAGRNYSAALNAANGRGNAFLTAVSLSSGANEIVSKFAGEAGAEFANGNTEGSLTAALANLNITIKKNAGYKNVKLIEKLSDAAEFVTADDGSLVNARYTKGGTNWTDTPAATVEGKKLTWDLGDTKLEDGVTYSVTFTIRPSAQALAEVAASGQAKTFDASVANESLVEYKTIVTTDGVAVVSDAQTSAFGTTSPTFELAAPASVTYDISDDISIIKKLTGRDLIDGEFTFELVENGVAIATTNNDDRGGVDFDELTYQTTGQHEYTIREINNGHPGVSYDDRTFQFTVNVVMNAQGKLEVEPVNKESFTFENTYEAAPATVNLTANKVLKGATLASGQFTFELVNNDDVIARATNDADGKIAFRELTLRQAGTYTFTIREVAANAEGMTYDTSEHTVKVTVRDNSEGQLEATVEGNNPTFTNSYKAPAASKPADSDKQMPQTDDTNNAKLPIALAIVAVVCIAGGVTLSRKKR